MPDRNFGFETLARRIAAIVLLADALNDYYRACKAEACSRPKT